jgi:hypothetical protein
MSQSAPSEVAVVVEEFVEKLVAGKIDHASARCDLMFALEKKGFQNFIDQDWLNGVLDLNTALRGSWRQYCTSQRTLDSAPAQEFYRAFSRKVHRNWPRRWTQAGGGIYDGKMIALKNDPIWLELSDFGFPFPPFALGSGMRVRSVDRRTAMKLGLIDLNRQVPPKEVPQPCLILLTPPPT